MTKRYSIADARSSLPSIVSQAEAGQEIELTRRGKPVAVVLSLRELARLRGIRTRFGEAYEHFLAQHALAKVGLDRHELQGLRDRSPARPVTL
jgi:prevent-host-death family protein